MCCAGSKTGIADMLLGHLAGGGQAAVHLRTLTREMTAHDVLVLHMISKVH